MRRIFLISLAGVLISSLGVGGRAAADKEGNPLPGDSRKLGTPLALRAVSTIVLCTPVFAKLE
jgi:hypothetical protein